jgi:DNA-binding LacI/PurR family transcriptional regulator
LYLSLAATLELRGVKTRLVIDPRPYSEQTRPFPELVRLVEAGEVQAVFMISAPPPILRWVARLPVARAVVTNQKIPHRVEFDIGQFIALALEYLKAQGCRSVGCLTGHRMAPLRRWNSARDEKKYRFFRLWVRKARELGLELRDEWHRASSKAPFLENELHNQFGYDQFMEFWRLDRRPEGLVVDPDSIAPGAIMAMKECRVAVPRQLKVVFQQSEEVALFCPMPAARVVCRVADIATALIEQVYRQLRGEPDQIQRVGFSLKLPENKPHP